MDEENTHGGAGRGQGRKPMDPSGEVMKERKVRMTDGEWSKAQALGAPHGAGHWIRERIKLAKLPRIDEAKDPAEPPKRRK